MKSENSMQRHVNMINETHDGFIENELLPFLRIPSFTLNKKGINQAKEFLISYIRPFSDNIKEFEEGLIMADVSGSTESKLLIYMMYDTQPITKEKEWISEPFGAVIKTLPPPLDKLDKCVIARGAYNSKSPLMCFLNVIRILKEQDALPLSLKLLFDAQEEIGSPFLLELLKNKKELFKGCTDAYYPSMKQDLSGKSILKLGYKGILSLTIKVSSKNKEPHSAFSSMIPNPVRDLIQLLNKIYANNEFLIDSLRKPYVLSEKERNMIDDLMEEINLEEIKQKAGIVETIENDPRKTFTNYLFKPTFNISTLKSGFLGGGTKNMVPNSATCNIDIRYAQDISIDEIYEEIQEITKKSAKKSKSHFELIKNIGYESSRVDKNSTLVHSLIQSAKQLGYSTQIWPLSAAAAPLSAIKKNIGLNFIAGGLGIGGLAHAPNEFVQLNSIIDTRLANLYFLMKYYENLQKEE
ncbi:MAG: M20/M25/M40 family metallo-hydrolase [Promethearchaeota archaeon]|nr:MAG: M20/M25/M40 family metallo-hydrolase [Candidatus Lokiarchaeota archaeon]